MNGYRKVIIFLILLVSLITFLYIPAFLGWRGTFHDDQLEEFPRYYFVAKNLQRGIIPLWNPHVWCGARIFYARYYADTYYLPLWPFLLLADINNLDKCYFILILLPLYFHFILAAFGMFFLIRYLFKTREFPAICGAIAYVFSPTFSYAYVWQQVVNVQTWMPWLLLIFISAVDRYRLWKIVLGGIILAFLITGAAPTLWPYVAILWCGVMVVLILSRRKKSKRDIISPIAVGLAIALLGVGLSGVYLISFIDGLRFTKAHIELTVENILKETVGSMPFPFLVTLFIPFLFDNITGINMSSLIPTHPILYWEANLSGGMFTTYLIILGVFLLFSKKTAIRDVKKFGILFFVIYLIGILGVMGRYTPFYKYIIGKIPFFGNIPRPIRYRYLQCFSSAILISLSLNFLFEKVRKIRKWTLFYLFISFLFIIIAFFWPLRPENYEEWNMPPESRIVGFLPPGCSAGNYAPMLQVRKIRVFFSGESKGEIRYADSHEGVRVGGGVLVRNYHVSEKGWHEFAVNIPAGKFVWIYQKSGNARIGYKRFQWDGFIFDSEIHSWKARNDTSALEFLIVDRRLSLWDRCKKGDKLAIKFCSMGFLYWIFFIIIAFLFSPGRVNFIGIAAILEFIIYGSIAFYFGTYSFGTQKIPEQNKRGKFSSHVFLNRMLEVEGVIDEPFMRIATTQPYQDNMAMITDNFALMGYEMYPLERRFKIAIEKSYNQPMDYPIYFNQPLPASQHYAFLNNFSVKYLFTQEEKELFENDRVVNLPHYSDYFVHMNPNALPRVYTNDVIISASEQEQFRKLTSGDLREGVYIPESYKLKKASLPQSERDYIRHFYNLQRVNSIFRVDFTNPNRIKIDADIKIPAMMILTELWYPGWYAEIDGKPAKVLRVNYCQRGIWVEEGEHTIKIFFEPFAWKLGCFITLGTLCLMVILFMFSIRHNLYGKI